MEEMQPPPPPWGGDHCPKILGSKPIRGIYEDAKSDAGCCILSSMRLIGENDNKQHSRPS